MPDSPDLGGALGPRPVRKRRARDPLARKQELTEAAERVIARDGIEALTHRAVAKEAGLPLASTTYHFATREDLIQHALEHSVDQFAAYLHMLDHQRPVTTTTQLVDRLTDAVVAACGPEREQWMVTYELFIAAARRPALETTAQRSVDLGLAWLLDHLPPARARAAAATLTGLILQAIATAQPCRRDDAHAVFTAICAA